MVVKLGGLAMFLRLFAVGLMLLFTAGCFGGGKTKTSQTLNGAGATFPYPVYVRWAKRYSQAKGIRVNYQGIGSGGGIRQVTDRTVDFGASDTILSPEELERRKLFQFPAVIGSIVGVYNLPGVKDAELMLSNTAVCALFMGKVQFWDDPVIAKDNPGLKLPHTRVTVVHRAEGSGTTWNFTYWLSKVCPEWREKVGYGKTVNWPAGVGAKGNAGVTNYVKQTPGAIGYVEYAYKVQNNLAGAQLQTAEGNFIKPSKTAFKASATWAKWSRSTHFYIEGNLILQKGRNSWPITAVSVILLPRDKKERNKMVVDFFRWAFENGDADATELGYIPLPESVKKEVQSYWQENVLR